MHAQTYWNILRRRRGSELRLTKLDDEIIAHLYKVFPDFDPAVELDEDNMKSTTGKEKWRGFMMAYEKTVDDYNFGTLLRRAPKDEYGEETTMFAPRMQVSTIGDAVAVVDRWEMLMARRGTVLCG